MIKNFMYLFLMLSLLQISISQANTSNSNVVQLSLAKSKIQLQSYCSIGCSNCVNNICYACYSSSGYYLSNGACFICPSQCYTCNNYSSCNSCYIGFSLIGGNCISNTSSCPYGCSDCVNKTCYSCTSGYYLSNGMCSGCSFECYSCNNYSSCNACNTGFSLIGGNCSSDTNYCTYSCSNCVNKTCYSCNSGYYLSSGYCNTCTAECNSCNSYSSCNACNSGYFPSSNGYCYSTPEISMSIIIITIIAVSIFALSVIIWASKRCK